MRILSQKTNLLNGGRFSLYLGAFLVQLMTIPYAHGSVSFSSKLDDAEDQAQVDAQVEEMEGYTYDDIATQTSIETRDLNRNIAKLKSKMQRLKADKESAERRAKRSTDHFAQTKQEKESLDKEAKVLEASHAKAQQELNRLEKRLSQLKSQKEKSEQRTQNAREALKNSEQKKSELLQQEKKLMKGIESQSRLKKNLDDKRSKNLSDIREIKARIAAMRSGKPVPPHSIPAPKIQLAKNTEAQSSSDSLSIDSL